MPVTGEIKICEIPSLILAYITDGDGNDNHNDDYDNNNANDQN